jgi:membrane peptidoglycan carboxypeptidase
VRHIQLFSLVNRRQHRKQAVAQSLRRRLARLGVGCGVLFFMILVAGLLGASLVYASLTDNLPSLEMLPEMLDPVRGVLMQPTRVYDRSGQELLFSLENAGIERRYLSSDAQKPDHFSPELVRVAVGALDPGFWQGAGFRLRSLANPKPDTIAERLVDATLLWNEPDGFRRAVRMRVLAAQVIARYGHVQVLEWYLNSAYYGHLAFGADSAARLYLGKPAVDLDLAESALIVAAIQAPALNPQDAPAAALERQRAVLDGLVERGVIPQAEYQQAAAQTLELVGPLPPAVSPAAAFSQLALEALAEQFGRERLERGGLRVITTLDYSLQSELSCLARTQLARLAGQDDDTPAPDGKECLSARLLPSALPGDQRLPAGTVTSGVVFHPQTGQVLALLGDTTLSGESSVLSPREPGTLLTPFVALAGFARGQGPATLGWDIPGSLADETSAGASASAATARPNPDGQYHGPVRLRLAIANDYLVPSAQLLEQIGPPNVWRLASALGLTSLVTERSPDILYRGGKVTLIELAQAYAVFASQGTRVGQRLAPGGDLRPAFILYVEDLSGRQLLDARTPQTQSVVTPQLAYLVHHVLRDETARWPSLGHPNALEIGRPAGAKVGQVEGARQVWAAGYTQQQVAVFSLSLPNDSTAQLSPRMAAGMWHAIMQYTSRDQPAADWTEPPGITHLEVCDPSGQLPTEACPKTASEVFLSGSEPISPDTLYRTFQINAETGLLATVFTPSLLVEEKTFMVVPPQARAWAQAAELPVPPQEYDAIQPPEPSADVQIVAPQLYAFVRGQVPLKGTASGEGFKTYQVQVGQGINPQTWLQVGQEGSVPVVNGEFGVWDTPQQDGLYSIRLQVLRTGQIVDTAVIQVTVDNTPPLVRVPYPIMGQEFEQGSLITFQAEGEDAIGIQRIIWLVDGKVVSETEHAPYVLAWQARPGEHVLQVKAIDLAGNEGISEQVQFSVK